MLREALAGKLRQLQTLELFSLFLPFFLFSQYLTKQVLQTHHRSVDPAAEVQTTQDYSRLLKATQSYSKTILGTQCRPDPQ